MLACAMPALTGACGTTGAGGCGKSTLMKQMRIINKAPFSADEIKEFTFQVRENLLNSMRKICKAQKDYDVKLGSGDNEAGAEYFRCLTDAKMNTLCSNGVASAEDYKALCGRINSLWGDKVVQELVVRGNEYMLNDSADYYIGEIGPETILKPDYKVTDADLLHARRATVKISKFNFQKKTGKGDTITLTFIDVGGQRDKRNKWMHVFDGVTAIMFVASMSEFDQMLEEAPTVPRMHESLQLFQAIVQMEFFETTPIVLFLNKIDLFAKKIRLPQKRKHFLELWPQYQEGDDQEEIKDFIKQLYIEGVDSIYPHFTTATNTQNIETVWKSVTDIVFNNNVSEMFAI